MTKEQLYDKIKKDKSLVIPDFLIQFKTRRRAVIRKYILELIIEKKVCYERTSATFLSHPKTNRLWVNCKDGSRNFKAIENLYCLYRNSFIYSVYVRFD